MKSVKILLVFALLVSSLRADSVGIVGTQAGVKPYALREPNDSPVVFATIGDYGVVGQNPNNSSQGEVRDMLTMLGPEFITTVGDNNYPSGSESTIDENITQFYGALINDDFSKTRFFPTPGNHDYYTDNAAPYLQYFNLPVNPQGNERYYTFTKGNIEFFMIDSNGSNKNPNGTQANYMMNRITNSNKDWKFAFFHHTPYAKGGSHCSDPDMHAWDFYEWGVDVVFAGHNHMYERIRHNGQNRDYIVIGSSGAGLNNDTTNECGGFNDPIHSGESLSLMAQDLDENGAVMVRVDGLEAKIEYWVTDGDSSWIGDCVRIDKSSGIHVYSPC